MGRELHFSVQASTPLTSAEITQVGRLGDALKRCFPPVGYYNFGHTSGSSKAGSEGGFLVLFGSLVVLSRVLSGATVTVSDEGSLIKEGTELRNGMVYFRRGAKITGPFPAERAVNADTAWLRDINEGLPRGKKLSGGGVLRDSQVTEVLETIARTLTAETEAAA